MADVRCEGIIEYFKLSDKEHEGPYSDSYLEKMPVVSIGIKSDQGELREFELPINIPKDPFSVILIEERLKGQRATYESTYENHPVSGFSGPVWNFQIHSGKFQGVKYTLEELID